MNGQGDRPLTQLLAARVRELRANRRWSARELAERCAQAGVPSLSRGTIAKIEAGVRGFITIDEVEALAAAFGMSPGALMQIAERPPPHSQDVEMVGLAVAVAVFERLDKPERERILTYLRDRYGQPDVERPPVDGGSPQVSRGL